jgi:putative addiction module component (TIGR02574 family)
METMNTSNELIDRVLSLPEPERASLARKLLLSLEPSDYDSDSDAAWAVELEARLAAVDGGRFAASEWRQTLTRIRQSLKGPVP